MSQNTDAAERSAHVTRGDAAPVADARPAWWVELVDEHGAVVRHWQTRFDGAPPTLRLQLRRVNP